MKRQNPHDFATALKELAESLDRSELVRRHDTETEKQAWTLAHSFLDLADSFQTFVEEQLPLLHDRNLSPEQTDAVLLEIGEEFRHILYHLRDPKFYTYLQDSVASNRESESS